MSKPVQGFLRIGDKVWILGREETPYQLRQDPQGAYEGVQKATRENMKEQWPLWKVVLRCD